MSLPVAGPGTYQYLRPRNGRDVTLPRPPRRMPRASDVCRPGSTSSALPGSSNMQGATRPGNARSVVSDAPTGGGPGPAPFGPPASVASASVSSRALADDGTTTAKMPRRMATFEKDDEPTDVVARRLWQPPSPPDVVERRVNWFLPVGFASLMAAILVLVALLVR